MATDSAGNNMINFEKSDVTSTQKRHSSADDFGETIAFNLIKQNVIHIHL